MNTSDSDCSSESDTYVISQRRVGYVPGYVTRQRTNSPVVNANSEILSPLAQTPSAVDRSRSEQSNNSLNFFRDQNSTNSGVNSHVSELVSQPVNNQSQGETQTSSPTIQQHTPQVTPHTIMHPEPVGRPQRLRQPPDRYGEWVMPIYAQDYNDCKNEVHIYYV
ncbi:hypothetical protein DPMN_028015 [Dreissena polymorpha]|uniref:Uncharacterized protein n=1 Tax=Dreissena polymorpha TaxID=45954 RepID=A0A9D4LTX2_DREPO|nr:hypothetical protein DPMN_028015 [Dreissena polymorpha]